MLRISLISWKDRSIRRKIDEVCVIVSEVKTGLHLIALTETWLNEEVSDAELQISGYNLFRRDRHALGGGIGIYVKATSQLLEEKILRT